MRRFGIYSIAIIALTIVLSVILVAADNDSSPLLPGLTSADEFPNGCVDCHKKDSSARAINVILADLDDHPNVAAMMKTIPDSCNMCHKEGGSAEPLQSHKIHYEDPHSNKFVVEFDGSCLHCHRLNISDNSMALKSGPKNW